MNLTPLGARVLIKPEVSADTTESGLILPENRSEKAVEMRGTVVAVGSPSHPRKLDAEMYAEWLEDQGERHIEAAELLRDLTRREPCVRVGDDVLFSWSAGQEITVEDETFLLLREEDLLAVVESA